MRFLYPCLLIAMVAAVKRDMDMDMNMDMDHDQMSNDAIEPASDDSNRITSDHTDSSDSASSTLIPVPHSVKHQHGMPILETKLTPEEKLYWESYSTETYFNTPSSKRGALYAHLALYVGSYVFLYPLVLVFWNVGHSLYLPALTLHTGLVVASVFTFWIFSGSVRELYPHSAFKPMTLLLFLGSLMHWAISVVAVAYRYLNIDNEFDYFELAHAEDGSSVHSPDLTLRDSNSHFEDFELESFGEPDGHLKTSNGSMLQPQPSRMSLVFLKFPAFKKATQLGGKTALALTGLTNWALFAYFLIYFPTGVATYAVYGTDGTIFNLLAHFIKGGVFFVLGLVTLARYCGAFRGKGWAWNHRFVTARNDNRGWLRWQPRGLWTMEFVESSLIFFYGSTNVFLEHLAGAGGAWTAKDLQHVSIAFIYLGCGLCGILLERRLSTWRYTKAVDNLTASTDPKDVAAVTKAHPGFSPNPFPILTIYWTGILMSKHTQASALSTEIHIQWGNLFVVGCVFRMMSYLIQVLVPSQSRGLTAAHAPFTEIVVAFALLCGGLIFMESCDPVVHLFEYYGYTSMFTLNVSLGFVALLMAWEMCVFSIKDALIRRNALSRRAV